MNAVRLVTTCLIILLVGLLFFTTLRNVIPTTQPSSVKVYRWNTHNNHHADHHHEAGVVAVQESSHLASYDMHLLQDTNAVQSQLTPSLYEYVDAEARNQCMDKRNWPNEPNWCTWIQKKGDKDSNDTPNGPPLRRQPERERQTTSAKREDQHDSQSTEEQYDNKDDDDAQSPDEVCNAECMLEASWHACKPTKPGISSVSELPNTDIISEQDHLTHDDALHDDALHHTLQDNHDAALRFMGRR